MRPHFWARLEFLSDASKAYVESQTDLSKAPWRPGFFYPDVQRQGFDIFPIARDGDEYGMYALSKDFWENFHVPRIVPGVEFELGMRPNIVAKGVVTRIGQDSD